MIYNKWIDLMNKEPNTPLMTKWDYQHLLFDFGLFDNKISECWDLGQNYYVKVELPRCWKINEKRVFKKAIKLILKIKGVGIIVRFFVKGKEIHVR